ncbi:MAG: folate-binding protein YgfZ [Gammaproteobacteria bacterium]|nr:folate-binding protein YgfZ [Gammaproteobacteria bacterium]MBU1732507.1 folate-binding protein YgfZ [Gammaproteobacteria bacterium]MBU1892643.1 folate-binding protein YgfZ [Gammaproteobacteria bacterium]
MNSNWQDFLSAAGAHIENQQLVHFGQPQEEILAAQNGSILTDLSNLSVIQFAGEDSENFLQGQLSCDVKQAMLEQARLGSYCTPKGRMLATFLLWRSEEGFFMQLPAPLREAIQKRLSMYVMRSKVKVSDASEQMIRLGIAGEAAPAALAELGGAAPEDDYAVGKCGPATLICLPGQRFEILVAPEDAAAVWQTLSKHCTPVGSGRWEWLEIQAGIPMVTAGTQEQFVPQMANMELIGGVSFTKGCYPGQEIVARSQYLGKVKRRMYRAHLQSDVAPQPGDVLFGQGPSEQSGGMVVNAQPAPDGGFDLLAVILNASIESSAVHWKTPDGPVLELLDLPYTVE